MALSAELIINGTDYSDKITDVNFIDKRTQTDYLITMEKYYITDPLPSNQSITLKFNDILIIENNTNIDFEINTRNLGTTIRIKVEK